MTTIEVVSGSASVGKGSEVYLPPRKAITKVHERKTSKRGLTSHGSRKHGSRRPQGQGAGATWRRERVGAAQSKERRT